MRIEIPRQVLECFKQIVGTSTLQDDPMDFKRVDVPVQKIKPDKVK